MGAKSSCSQGTSLFCPIKSSPGSRQGKERKAHSSPRALLRIHSMGRADRGEPAGSLPGHLSRYLIPRELFLGS